MLRKYRQPIYDEEKIGNGAATNSLRFFTRPQGQQDNAAHAKTARDTNMIQSGQLGAKGEFYLVGISANLDWNIVCTDTMTATANAANNETFVMQQIYTDSLFTYQFGRGQPLLEIPLDKIPSWTGPYGILDNNNTQGALQFAQVLANGIPSSREFYDLRLEKGRPHHIQPEQTFLAKITWDNGAITIGTASGAEWYRLQVYMIGILLSSL